ncbi:MAG: DUF6473 family protein [Pseudomonadota bacterium]
MMHLDAGAGALDYFPCRYGASKAVFRGPARDLTVPYVAVLGGSASFGKYVASPYADLLERALGRPVANLAALNAGPDLYLSDPATLEIATGATVAILQITGAEAVSNPLYSVHGRRNDRFLTATPALRALYPEVDLTEVHFTRHLLMVLRRTDGLRFRQVLRVLKANWLLRMRELLARLPQRRILLWLSDAPAPVLAEDLDPGFGPLLIDRSMIAALQADGGQLVEAVPSETAKAEGPAGMLFPEVEALQARCLPGQTAHAEIALHLTPMVRRLMEMATGATVR